MQIAHQETKGNGQLKIEEEGAFITLVGSELGGSVFKVPDA